MNIKELWLQSVDSWAKQEAMEKSIPEFFAALVADHEREACAKLCDDMDSISDYYGPRVELICAEAIRARSNT